MKDLQKGDKITADWLRELVREVRRNRVVPGHGLRLEAATPEGKVIALAPRGPAAMRETPGWPFGERYAFGLAIAGAVATIYPGSVDAGGSYYTTAETPITIASDGQYIGVALDRSTGSATITGPHNTRPVASGDTWASALYSFDFSSGKITGWHDHIHDIRLDAVI